ncbi:hypothetical protein [uncultured Jannaschia sp.]|uniref:hypothetical protein n=1 Tax=uncultured Jannaschia sp. TaxID=293347 RepID=UPI0026302EE2|nr:hypothetical protein [uncultured Jannaschia sp.]
MSAPHLPEDPGVPNGIVIVAIAVSFSLVAAAALAVWIFYPDARHDQMPRIDAFPEPQLEIEPVARYAEYLAEERARLSGAEDRLPIDAAMARIVARGAVAFAPLPAEDRP